VCVCVCPDRKDSEKRSSGSSAKDKPSDDSGGTPAVAPTKVRSDTVAAESEAVAPAPAPPSSSSPKLNGQQELLHSEGDTQSN